MNRTVTPLILFALLVAVAAAGCNSDATTDNHDNRQATEPASRTAAAAKTTAASKPAAAAKSAQSPAGEARPEHVAVYYFHGTRRCSTCRGIQAAIEKTIKERFTVETMDGSVRFYEVNIDEAQNKHFVKAFNLSFSSMVVAVKDGKKTIKWNNCDKIWPLAHQPEALAKYVEEQIRASLASLKSS